MGRRKDEKSFERIKLDYLKIAKQLGYGQDVLLKIEQAKDEIAIGNIMKTARERGAHGTCRR